MLIRQRGIRTRRRSAKRLIAFKMLVCLVAIVVTVAYIDSKLRSIITTVASYQARVYATKAINDAVSRQLAEDNVQYENLVNITKDDAGDITSIQANMIEINRLKASITNAVLEEIMQIQEQKISIPVGTLLGNQFTSGRGPRIPFKLIPAGFASTSISNRFESAGINQTRHQIMLDMTTNMTAIVPGYTVATEVTTNICLAETVIVGRIPANFTQVEGSLGGMPNIVADYGTSTSS